MTDEHDTGASADAETGSRASHEAARASSPSGFEAARERMSAAFSVFNGHLNDADKRAREFMSKRCPTYLARVEALEREGRGIMCLFHVCGKSWGPKAARRYIELVTNFVNEDAIATEDAAKSQSERTGA